jgi:hypothetical protein
MQARTHLPPAHPARERGAGGRVKGLAGLVVRLGRAEHAPRARARAKEGAPGGQPSTRIRWPVCSESEATAASGTDTGFASGAVLADAARGWVAAGAGTASAGNVHRGKLSIVLAPFCSRPSEALTSVCDCRCMGEGAVRLSGRWRLGPGKVQASSSLVPGPTPPLPPSGSPSGRALRTRIRMSLKRLDQRRNSRG